MSYEALTRSPGEIILGILAHCGLAEEPQVFESHKTKRAVRTASVAQVREPISTARIGGAEPYAAHMAPFHAAYRHR